MRAEKGFSNLVLVLVVASLLGSVAFIGTSPGQAGISNSASCVAHIGFELDTSCDVWAQRYEPGYPGSIQLKFARPQALGLARARLHLYAYQISGSAYGNYHVMRVDDQAWDESITEAEFDNQAVAEVENFRDKWTSVGWDWVDVTDQLRAETGDYLTLRLSTRSSGWDTYTIIDDDTLKLGTSEYNLEIMCYSSEAPEKRPWLEVILPSVATSIWPSENYGRPGENITFKVTVKNNWVDNDNFDLTVEDNADWGLTLTDLLENVAPGESRTVTLSVTIPENAEPSTEDEITVTATSWADSIVSDSVSCIAHVISENTFLLDLVGGKWNLVGFPATDTTPDNVLPEIYYIWRWDAVGETYVSPSSTAPVDENVGYWIWVEDDWKVRIGVPVTSGTINLVGGKWNSVHFPATNENTTPDNLFAGYTYYIWKWDPVGGTYVSASSTAPVELGVGYWIWIDSDKTVTVPL